MIPDYQANDARQKSHLTSSGEISAQLDRLEARVADAGRQIDAALTPEPVDWDAYYRELFAAVVDADRRVAEGGV